VVAVVGGAAVVGVVCGGSKRQAVEARMFNRIDGGFARPPRICCGNDGIPRPWLHRRKIL